MSNPISLIQQSKQALSQKQAQRLIMSEHMQQALNLLQMPLQELSTVIQSEIEQNPVLEYAPDDIDDEASESSALADRELERSLTFNDQEYDVINNLDRDFKDLFSESRNPALAREKAQERSKQDYFESLIVKKESLFEHLMAQARESFDTKEELACAEVIAGYLDESGFLTTSVSEIAALQHLDEADLARVLKVIQTFEPFGVGAKNLRECLLIQLSCLSRQSSVAYRVVDEAYELLLNNRIPEIQKRLKCPKNELNQAIYKDIAKLDFHPGSRYSQVEATPIIPDVSIVEREGELVVVVNDEEYLPNVRLNPEYVRLVEQQLLALETKEFIKQKVTSAKWLLRNIHQRGTTLQKIAYSLLKRQNDFFTRPDGQLVPLTMLTISEELELHESTIARAVANKYVETPRGIFPLRYFFTNAIGTESGEISSNTVRDLMIEMINAENKKKPMSDNAIAKKLHEKGIECSRRTVAKYRSQLKLGNAHQRRQY